MKKLLLLLAAGVSILSVQAQQNTSIVLNNTASRQADAKYAPIHKGYIPTTKKTNPVSKTTSSPTVPCWFGFEEALTSTVENASIYPIYNDSSLYIPNGTPAPFFWYIAGLGTSFDPTSVAFNAANYASPTVPIPTFKVTSTNAYTVDSIQVVGYYNRKVFNDPNIVDTLNIYVVATGTAGNGAAAFTYNKDAYFYNNLSIPDSIFHTATVKYDMRTNSVNKDTVPSVIKIQKILDATAFADSVGTTQHSWSLPLNLSVPAGGKVVAYEQYISGHQYSFGIPIDSANTWDVLTVELNGASSNPSQFKNDFNSGLVMTTSSRYNIDTQAFLYQGSQYILSTYLYGATAGFDNPYFQFHIKCPTCINTSVEELSNIITVGEAYPVPAVSSVTIPFAIAHNADVTVSLINTVGQTVRTQQIANTSKGKASFNVGDLASGLYFYSISAEGQHANGRIVVAH